MTTRICDTNFQDMKDYLGNSLKVGDRIVFATSKGYNEPLRKGTIIGFTYYLYDDGRIFNPKANIKTDLNRYTDKYGKELILIK